MVEKYISMLLQQYQDFFEDGQKETAQIKRINLIALYQELAEESDFTQYLESKNIKHLKDNHFFCGDEMLINYWHFLSPSEKEIFVSIGKAETTAQMDERLVVSRRTIETHLSFCLRKARSLGIKIETREQLFLLYRRFDACLMKNIDIWLLG